MSATELHTRGQWTQADLAVGVDIGGTNTAVGVMTGAGSLLGQTTFATDAAEGAQRFVARLAAAIDDSLQKAGTLTMVQAIGIACPAVNTREGIVENPANLGWGRVDLVGMLQKYKGVPISLLNDGDAAAIGESRFGAAREFSTFVMITLGTGMGGGIVVDGELVRGANGTGGEIGHIIIDPGGRVCACGRKGCAETYVSATGVCRTVAELVGRTIVPSPLRDIPFTELTARRVFELAHAGDRLSNDVFTLTGNYLGRLLANLAAVFDPEAIVLYGGLVHAGDLLVEPTIRTFKESVLERYQNTVQILVSRLNDGQAPILGAGAYALEAASIRGPAKANALHRG